MRKIYLLSLLLYLQCSFVNAQVLPSIGLISLPFDSDSICTIPIAQGSGSVPGIMPGNSVPDFKLYTLAGDSVVLSEILQSGKPVLLISSSYTCPVFRGKIPVINMVDSIYQGQLNVYVIYTVEAHPIIDVSPYSGNVWTTSANQTEGILFEQPKTYGERKTVVDAMLSSNYLRPSVLIDGPCNEWWLNFGTEPNSATLIQANGTVFAFQQWFDKAPENIFCEIDSLLGTSSGQCSTFGNGGTFTWSGDTIEYGIPGYYIAVNSTLTNNSSTENVEITIQRQGTQMPATWLTALCTDICYPPTTTSAQVTIPPGAAQAFIFYFYTDTTPASGMAQVRFVNQNNTSNQVTQRFYGSTETTGINENSREFFGKIYPNPVKEYLYVDANDNFNLAELYDIQGKLKLSQTLSPSSTTTLEVKNNLPGVYLLKLSGKEQTTKKIIIE